MGVIAPRRAAYRARQFVKAVAAYLAPLTDAERAAAHAILPATARPLFDALPRNDQRHSLAVLRTLQAARHDEIALLQAALLHDAGKAAAGLTLLHRAAIVLLKAFRPQVLAAWGELPQPARSDLRYPFWAHANHPAIGADMAAAAGCEPLAVSLIRLHQASSPTDSPCGGFSLSARDFQSLSPPVDRLLAALQAADNDN